MVSKYKAVVTKAEPEIKPAITGSFYRIRQLSTYEFTLECLHADSLEVTVVGHPDIRSIVLSRLNKLLDGSQ